MESKIVSKEKCENCKNLIINNDKYGFTYKCGIKGCIKDKLYTGNSSGEHNIKKLFKEVKEGINHQQKNCSNCKSYYNQIECIGCSDFIKHKYMNDNLNQQGTALTATHYQREGTPEPIQEMQANYTKEEFTGFLKGTAKKYQDRLGRKSTTTEGMCEDITKAIQYLYWLKLHLQGVKIEPMKHVLEEKQ